MNALAAIAVASELDVEDRKIENAFASFAGIDRRFQVINRVNCCDGSFTLIDDYGHHPSEIKATIDAVKLSWPDKKITLVFQPHRFSRTRDLFDDFIDALSIVDHALIAEIYPAGEKPIDKINSKNIVSSLKDKTNKPIQYLSSLGDAVPILYELMKNDEVLLVMGAGDVGKFAAELPRELAIIK